MAIELNKLITEELRGFKGMKEITPVKDPVAEIEAKRGPRHRSDKIGLNLNRKHQNVIADWHKADPNQIGALERLRGLPQGGRDFVTHQEGEQLKQKYGLQTDDGYLGTTGIRMIRTPKGFDLVKEAKASLDGEKFTINDPDELWNSPLKGICFSEYDNIIYYGTEYHWELLAELLKPKIDPNVVKFYPRPPTPREAMKVQTNWKIYYDSWAKTATKGDRQDWGNYGNPRDFFHLAGRSSIPEAQPQLVAFWNNMHQINKKAALLDGFFKKVCGLNDPLIVTLDNKQGLKMGQTPVKPIGNIIDQEIMKHQHLVPALKRGGGRRRNGDQRTSVGSTRLGDVAHKAGYRNSAEYRAANVIGDSKKVNGRPII